MMLFVSIVFLGVSGPELLFLFPLVRDGQLARLSHRFGMEPVIVILAFLVLVAFIIASSCFALLRRKGKTGSFLLSTAELNVQVARFLEPGPPWKRIVPSALYFLLAGGLTYGVLTGQVKWFVAAVVWLGAILNAVGEFRRSRRRQSASALPEGQQTPPGPGGS